MRDKLINKYVIALDPKFLVFREVYISVYFLILVHWVIYDSGWVTLLGTSVEPTNPESMSGPYRVCISDYAMLCQLFIGYLNRF